ncbi:DDE-type integrase/transposase/recombinase [Nocardia gipuzkoensis]|nr:DDE-type integrase/transposase/recombinase [Nocardia gipuzkoensis]MDE1675348.1 DDE-type integrase/transposase/recombinase [Nocardia gipuzkoensis]
MSLEEHKRAERAQAIGLFRYRLICPALDEGLSTKQRGRLVREIAATTHTDPFGNPIVVARNTIDRWVRNYRKGGFEALVPSPRLLGARTDAQVLELAASLKRENPARTVAQVARILRTATGWAPSESTLLRHFHRLELMGPAVGHTGEVFGRFEAADPNELWCGDALHGPRVGDRKTYLFAFIDDHTRLLTGYRFGYAEDTVRLAAALRPALAARGVPAAVYVDNGSAYSDAWLLRACAKLGVRLTHSTPGRPQGRGKIERFLCATRRMVVFPVQPGGTRREVPGSDGLPGAERWTGTRACQITGDRVQVSGTVCWETRAIRRKLDCLNPNLQKRKVRLHRKDIRNRCRPCDGQLIEPGRNLRGKERCPVRALKEMSGTPTSR